MAGPLLRSLAPCALGGALLVLSSAAVAVDYLTEAQARALLFPAAAQWQDEIYTLSPEQQQTSTGAAQSPVRATNWRFDHAFDADKKYLGSVVVDQVVGKFELITYAVALDAAGAITGVEILSYRESHGGEVRLPAWRRQFVGKNASQPIQVGNDIALISGATLSCNHLTDGVRRIVALQAVLRSAKRLPA